MSPGDRQWAEKATLYRQSTRVWSKIDGFCATAGQLRSSKQTQRAENFPKAKLRLEMIDHVWLYGSTGGRLETRCQHSALIPQPEEAEAAEYR